VIDQSKRKGAVSRLTYAARAAKSFTTQPSESLERTREKAAEWHDGRRAGVRYVVTEAPDARVHQLVGTGWPCEELDEFDAVWAAILDDLATRGLRVGRGAFGGWDDGDTRLDESLAPLAGAEFLVVDTETNGLSGEACEMTEVGAVLVGGGELHDRWSSLVRTAAPLRRGIQRFTGITQTMIDGLAT